MYLKNKINDFLKYQEQQQKYHYSSLRKIVYKN
jgi:hypothetical protein